MPPQSAAKKASFELVFNAMSANSLANAMKFSFLPTKSVSHPKTIATPSVWFALIFETAAPSDESLSALFSATFCPFLRRTAIALSKSPSASTKAFLQSIIPAPVACLNLFTSAAVTFTVVLIVVVI